MKWKLLPLIVLFGLLFLIPKSSSYTMENVYVSLNTNASLGLGGSPSYYIVIEVTSGSINSTVSQLEVDDLQGSWTTYSNASGTVEITSPERLYHIRTSNGATNENPGETVTDSFTANQYYTIYWDLPVEPILPFGFILGMIGLGSMFGGTLWTVKKLKDHEWNEAITEGFVIALLGIALFMAWLAMA